MCVWGEGGSWFRWQNNWYTGWPKSQHKVKLILKDCDNWEEAQEFLSLNPYLIG